MWGSDDKRDKVHVQRLVNRLPRASMAARSTSTTHQHTYLPTNLVSVCSQCVLLGPSLGRPLAGHHLEGFLFWGPIVLVAAIVEFLLLFATRSCGMPCTRIEHHVPGRVHPFFPVLSFSFFWLPLQVGALGVAPQGAREWQYTHHAHYSVRSVKKGRGDGCRRVTAGCCTVGPLESNTVLCWPFDISPKSGPTGAAKASPPVPNAPSQ